MKDIHIVFHRPPVGPAGPIDAFVEVEDGDGRSLRPESSGATWLQRSPYCWTLGPFASQGGVDSERESASRAVAQARGVLDAVSRADGWGEQGVVVQNVVLTLIAEIETADPERELLNGIAEAAERMVRALTTPTHMMAYHDLHQLVGELDQLRGG